MAKFEQLEYFRCHGHERVVVVWRDQNLLIEKVENLETWLANFEHYVNCMHRPSPPPRTRLDNLTSITSND